MPSQSPVTVALTRVIAAPVADVFNAWIDPALISRWLAPDPCEVVEARTDPRPGGRYIIVVREPNGMVHTTTGEYVVVEAGRRLVKTWAYEGPHGQDDEPTVLTVEFVEEGPRLTRLTLTHARIPASMQTMVSGGWTLCLNKLDRVFAVPPPAGAATN